jgi:hypothetical protein
VYHNESSENVQFLLILLFCGMQRNIVPMAWNLQHSPLGLDFSEYGAVEWKLYVYKPSG